MPRSILRSSSPLVLAAAVFASIPAHAVGTRTFVLDSLDDLKGGDLKGTSVDSSGAVRAGLSLGALPITDATSVWSSAVLPDGAVLLGTGNDGKVFRVQGADVSLAATTDQMAASAMAVAWNGDVVIGTFPDGKIFRLPGRDAKGRAAAELVALEGAEDVWDLAYDAKNKALYAATGPEGKVFRVDAQGKAQVYFDSEEPHLVSLALGDDGALYAGSNGKALLYKIIGPGRASVVHDFDGDDVKAIAIAPAAKGGALYAIANKYSEVTFPSKKNKGGAPAAPQSVKPPKPGRGVLVRVGKDGVVEKMLDDDKTHFVSLALGDDGAPYVGTGADGLVYTVSDDHVVRLLADTDERQVGALVMAGKRRFVATTDPVVFHEVRGIGGADAVWTSKVLDAGLRASFGRLTWRGEGAVELSTRTGDTDVPEATWSAWSPGLAAPGDTTSPPGRYVQVRARWTRDPDARLREVTLAFVTDNARPVVTSIEAGPRSSKSALKVGIVASGGQAPKPSATLHVTWKVENPDQDELRYRVWYRLEGQSRWNDALEPGQRLTRTELDWDTSTLPEGEYRLMVEASDEGANPPDRVKRHSLVSPVVLVDNTPPVFRSLTLQGRRLEGEVADGLGPIARVEIALGGSDDFRPLAPADGIFDEPVEALGADLSALVPAGPHLVAVRAYDAAGNAVTRNVEAK
jgi:hypothetical protein